MAEGLELPVDVRVAGSVEPAITRYDGFISFESSDNPERAFQELETHEGIEGVATDFRRDRFWIKISERDYQEKVTLRLEGERIDELLATLRKEPRKSVTAFVGENGRVLNLR